jgi:hypothetical protein
MHQRELTGTRGPGLGYPNQIRYTGFGRREAFMRNFKIVLALLAVSGLAVLGSAPAQAVGTRYPFCIQGNDFPGLSNCTFTSYAQCEATASGRFLYCLENPYYIPGGEPRGHRGRNRVPAGYQPYPYY